MVGYSKAIHKESEMERMPKKARVNVEAFISVPLIIFTMWYAYKVAGRVVPSEMVVLEFLLFGLCFGVVAKSIEVGKNNQKWHT